MTPAPRRLEYTTSLSAFYDHKPARADAESRLIAQLAMNAHERGEQFAAWPTITTTRNTYFDSVELKAEVWVIPR